MVLKFLKGMIGGADDTPQAASGNGGGSAELPAGHEQFVVCKYCQRKVKKGVRHQCQPMRERRVAPRRASEDEDDFFVSFLIAYTTDSWGFGYMGGGNLMGAILGEALREDGYEEDISPDLVQEAGEDAFLDPSAEEPVVEEDAGEDPVIAIDPDAVEEAPAHEAVDEPADTGPDIDDTAGDSDNSY